MKHIHPITVPRAAQSPIFDTVGPALDLVFRVLFNLVSLAERSLSLIIDVSDFVEQKGD